MKIKVLILVFCLLLAACSDDSNGESSMAVLNEQEQFLVDNAARSGVSVTESGLQYEVLTYAEGASPTQNDTILVHYVGSLIDGTEFDNSFARGVPNEFVLGRTIDGWIEGVQLMNVGSKYRFVIPPELAYGDRGTGTLIEPGDVLIFEVDLLEIISG